MDIFVLEKFSRKRGDILSIKNISVFLDFAFNHSIMNSKSANQSYLPVAWDYREIIDSERNKRTSGKVFYFNESGEIDVAEGSISQIIDNPDTGIFILLDHNQHIRIDRIITLYGKPGAAYEEYDVYANACMDCNGGYLGEDNR
ncbi:hypothetical protein D3C87_769870 [compost metagenome]